MRTDRQSEGQIDMTKLTQASSQFCERAHNLNFYDLRASAQNLLLSPGENFLDMNDASSAAVR